MANQLCKAGIRRIMRIQRGSLSARRRRIAKERAFEALQASLPPQGFILSYASFGSELCTWDLNFRLAASRRLVLPLVVGKNLRLYRVANIKTELTLSRMGILEPNPDLCEPIDLHDVSYALIPGLAFDPFNHRLGYGNGYYDRLLSGSEGKIHTLGVGFTEQQIKKPLPIEETDVPLEQIALF